VAGSRLTAALLLPVQDGKKVIKRSLLLRRQPFRKSRPFREAQRFLSQHRIPSHRQSGQRHQPLLRDAEKPRQFRYCGSIRRVVEILFEEKEIRRMDTSGLERSI